ncbi:endonuclease [Longibacter salinarum]|uniref:Endonuclease n=1 Tax=Longibacter salinarum TaxID=1850348 RepID=A0A2A8CZW3_9BACT|nr:GIY-YIG nuclease family protein [Longibacter salinarum]PEN14141.1 endonuclease [Longibacter salinarum]
MSDTPSPDDTGHYVYILECCDGTYYTGYTTDVERRVEEHNAGTGARYTRGRTPVDVVYTESYDSQSAAMSREYAIKQLRRGQKERLVSGDDV